MGELRISGSSKYGHSGVLFVISLFVRVYMRMEVGGYSYLNLYRISWILLDSLLIILEWGAGTGRKFMSNPPESNKFSI